MIKYKMYVLFLLILCIFSINYISAKKDDNLPLFGKVIYLDPGHGGLDPGAMYGGLKEKNINLEISKAIQNVLIKEGAIVYLTRDGDYDLSITHTINRKRSDLSRRSNIINKSKCDLFLSIHLNAEDTNTWRGAQVFYNSENKENKAMAELFQKYMKDNLGSTRKAKKDNDLYLQKRIERPGLLLELGFISNASDRYLLKQKYYQKKIAETIKYALIDYFK